MIFNAIVLIIGLLILGAGLYYLVKEKADRESRKIYGITSLVGAAITIFSIIRFVIIL